MNAADSFFAEPAEAIADRLDAAMRGGLPRPGFSERENVALACRVLADEGHARSLAGQVTARAAAGGFWTTGFGAGFADTDAGNLVRIDAEMNVLEGIGMPNPGVRFHLWIYARRPDLGCIVHTHPPHCSALGLTGQPLIVAHMDTAMFFENCAFLAEWPGLPIANDEGRIIADALGPSRAIVLAHHGMLTVGAGIEEATYLAVLLEQGAGVQLAAMATGRPIRAVDPALAREARDFLLKPAFVAATFDYWARRAARRHPDALARG